jgi:serine protein kinase
VAFADFWIQEEVYVDPATGVAFDKSALNSELEKMEKPAGIGNPKDFRHEIVNHVLRAQNKSGGDKLVWTSYQKLRPVVSYFAKGNAEDEKKHEAFIARMKARGHTPTQVRRQVEWWTMARRQ